MITEALLSLRPNAKFQVLDESIDGITWLDEDQTRPTDEEILAEVENVKISLALNELRRERNRRLAETDFYALSDVTMTDEMSAYRQSLRDITDTYSSLDEVVWPEKP